jgi:hypothetical protein
MLDKFWESISTDLAKRWIEYIFGPAFLFWFGGLAIYTWQTGWQKVLTNLQLLKPIEQVLFVIITFLVLAFSSILVHTFRFPVLRLLEGYWPWPFNFFSSKIIAYRQLTFHKKYNDLHHLKAYESKDELDFTQRSRLAQLEVWAHWNPTKPNDLLPTALGNIIRSREQSPADRYGLDAMVCWPRLWALLPENVRDDLTKARNSLDQMIELWLWGLLFFIFIAWTPWVLVLGLLWVGITYNMSLQAAMTYGELLESSFDLYRLSLYDALGWPRPQNREEEKANGYSLTEFLWRGTLPEGVGYQKV